MPSSQRLPSELEHFLSRYPHPVAVLRAQPIYDTLVSRKKPYAPETKDPFQRREQRGHATSRDQYENGLESVPAPLPKGVTNALLEQRRLREEAALQSPLASPALSDLSPSLPSVLSPDLSFNPTALDSLSPLNGSATALSSRRSSSSAAHSRSGPASRAHSQASRILSDAFEGPALLNRGYPALNRSSLLEGGSQQAHDASRTAEGAVAELYAQRARHDAATEEEEREEAREEKRRDERREENETKEHAEFVQADGMQFGGKSAGLRELLRPVWRNGKWSELMEVREDAKDEVEGVELDLLAVLSRPDLQELLAVLTNVVEHLPRDGAGEDERQASTPLAQLDHTVLLELQFPPPSIYHHGASPTRPPPASRPSRHILPRNPPTSADRPHEIYSPKNAYGTAPPPDQAAPAPPPHHGIQRESHLRSPFLQVVATLHRDTGLVVLTTISANLPLLTRSRDRPSEEKAPSAEPDGQEKPQQNGQPSLPEKPRQRDGPGDDVASSPTSPVVPPSARPPFASTPSLSRLSRPPLTQRHSGHTSLSNASSSGSTVVGTAASAPAPMPSTSPSSATVDPPTLRTPQDNVPTPLQGASEAARPEGVEALTKTAIVVNAEDMKMQEYPRRLPVEMPGRVAGGGGDGTVNGIGYEEDFDGTNALAILNDSYTGGSGKFPRGFVKESPRLALRRAKSSTTPSERRDRDNDVREREWEKRAEREKREARLARGREGLGELVELEEPPSDEDEDEDEDDLKAYDEEYEQDLERLRHKTRTGSTSSAGSAHDEREGTVPGPPRPSASPLRNLHASTSSDKNEWRQQQQQHYPLHSSLFEHRSNPSMSSAPSHGGSMGFARSSTSASLSSSSGAVVHQPAQLAGAPHEEDPFFATLASTPCGRLIKDSVDWGQTSLGDIHSWSPELRSQVMLMLASPFHESLWMGPENVLLYNDAYATILGDRHPLAMGRAGALGWSEVWDQLGPLAAEVMQGKTVSFSDHCICHIRHGSLEETYHSWAYICLRSAEGKIIGYTNPSFETTARVIAERRLNTLRELTTLTSLARTTSDFCSKALRALATNALDLPFSILYTIESADNERGRRTKGSTESSSSKRPGPGTATAATNTRDDGLARMLMALQGTVGVPAGHSSAPAEVEVRVDLKKNEAEPASSASSASSVTGTHSTNEENATSTVWPFIEALTSRRPVFISDVGARADGFHQRGWPDPTTRAVCIPIMTEGSMIPKAMLVVGLNSRRPWNEVYATFLNLISRSLSTGLLGIEVAEEAARKSQATARQRFFANLSHELRTPLTLILGPLEDVLTSQMADEDRDRLTVVTRNAHRLLNMVNTLLDFSRLESGKMEASFRPTQLGPRVADLASLFRVAIERGGIEFRVEVANDDYADADPFYLSSEMLEKLVFNLLGNAFKYTISGTISVQVSFTRNEGIIAIQDTGVGIEENELDAIFDRFHRINSAARSFEGSGIGLSLVLELVKTLGGTIEVRSEVDKGSTFTVKLPRGTQHLPPDAVDDEPYEELEHPRPAHSLSIVNDAAAWRVEAEQERAVVSTSNAIRRASDPDPVAPNVFHLDKERTTVMVVDDNRSMRQFVAGVLSRRFSVVDAPDGQQALELILANPPSLILSDIAMPRMSGKELLRAVRSNPDPSISTIPFIFLSAQAGADSRVEALVGGAEDILSKPFQAQELLARVSTHLQLGAMRKELDRKVQERTAELSELSEQYEALTLLSPVAVFKCARDGEMLYVNPHTITGHPVDAPHTEWRNDIDPPDLPRVEKLWAEAISEWSPTKPAMSFEYRYRNGIFAQLSIRSYPGGFIGSVTDVTHRKEIEAHHIRESEHRAIEAEEQRRNTEIYLDASSHEIRNPLSGTAQNADVLGESLERLVEFLELQKGKTVGIDPDLLDEMISELWENIDAVDSIKLCCSHQQRIADDLLNVSKLNMGLLSINLSPFNLMIAVGEVVKTFEAQAAAQNVALRVEEGESLRALRIDWIVADSGRVKQVAINFLTNALKYAVDSAEKVVAVRVDAYDKAPPIAPDTKRIADADLSLDPPPECVWIRIAVTDSGRGLTGEQLDTLFARFKQAQPKTDQYGGSGLGLYISRKILSLHRGFAEVTSQPGAGSTFAFAVPAPRATPPPASQVNLLSPSPTSGAVPKRLKRPTSSSGRPPSASPTTLSTPTSASPSSSSCNGVPPLRVLLCEDNLINQKVMLRQLKTQGFDVIIASDGQQGLDALVEDERRVAAQEAGYNQIRVVLSDIEMPVMGGLEFAQKVREKERSGEFSRRYPLCAVTGNAREEKKEECLSAGFDDVATKPYRLAELLQQISKLTGLPVAAPK
ncbi:hypothetical protein JCM10213v2_007667 [Rhodosporidiobolus nylandii]